MGEWEFPKSGMNENFKNIRGDQGKFFSKFFKNQLPIMFFAPIDAKICLLKYAFLGWKYSKIRFWWNFSCEKWKYKSKLALVMLVFSICLSLALLFLARISSCLASGQSKTISLFLLYMQLYENTNCLGEQARSQDFLTGGNDQKSTSIAKIFLLKNTYF